MSTDFARFMPIVAKAVYGEPNEKMSSNRELRFGSSGSKSVNLESGTYYDHENAEGGGVLDLVKRVKGLSGRDAIEWLRELGCDIEDDRSPRAHANGHDAAPPRRQAPQQQQQQQRKQQRTKREIVATYPYVGSDEILKYEVVRFEWVEDGKRKKTFSQRRPAPDEPGVWIWSLSAGEFMRHGPGKDWRPYDAELFERGGYKERRRFDDEVVHGLYRLPEVIEEMASGRTIYLPEGEKDCETLWEWGVPATTNSGGAKNWRDYHAEYLRGADVVISIDNDMAGRERGDKIAASLHGIAKRVRLLDLAPHWPGMPEKADITDWRDHAGGSLEKLLAIVRTLPDWSPPPFVSRFGMVPWERLDEPGPEHEYVIDGWFTVGDKSIVGGPSKSGKSFLAIHAAMSIARGTEFFGHKVRAPGLVVYQAGEGARGIKKRLRAYRRYFDVPKTERVPFVLLQSKIDLYRADGDTPALIEEIRAICGMYDAPLRAIFIDTLATATGGADENSGRDMSAVMANVDRLSAAFGAHVCLVHHLNASGTKLRGHTSIFANIDQAIFVTRDEATKVRTAVLDKQKDDEDGGSIRFELLSVEIGRRQDDDKPITSCVCVQVGEREMQEKRTAAAGFALKPKEEPIFRALLAAAKSAPRIPDDDMVKLGVPSDAIAVHYRDWRDAYKVVGLDGGGDGEAPGDDAIRKRFERDARGLISFGVMGWKRPWLWWTGKPVRGFHETQPARTYDRTETGQKLDSRSSVDDDDDDVDVLTLI